MQLPTRAATTAVFALAALAARAHPTMADVSLIWRPLGEPGCGGDITAVRINPHNTTQIFIAGDMLGVGVSMDGGRSFSSPNASSFLSYEAADFSFDPVLRRVYVATASGPYYSNMSTPLQWQSIREGMPAVDSVYGGYPAAMQIILIDPASAGRRLVALGGSKRGWARVHNAGTVWESIDAGESWRNISRVAPASYKSANVMAAAWSAGETVWAAVKGVGMSRSVDGGLTWEVRWPAGRSTTLASGAVHPTNPDIAYAAFGDGTGVVKTTNGGKTWTDSDAGLPAGGNFEAFGISESDPETLYVGSASEPKHAWVTHDGGLHWLPTGSPPKAQAYGLGMQASFLSVHPTDKMTVLYATWVTLWQTKDGGTTWSDLTANAKPGDDTGTMWNGTGYGGLVTTNVEWNPYVSEKYKFKRAFLQGMDAGKIWAAADAGSPPAFWRRQTGLNAFGGGNALAFAADGMTVFAGTGQFGWPAKFSTEGVVLSVDAGDTWSYACGYPNISGTVQVNALCITPQNISNVWAVFQDGRLYYSDDRCTSWSIVSEVNDTVTDLVCPQAGTPSADSPNPADVEIYAAGRLGVYALGPTWGTWVHIPAGPQAWQYSTNWCRLAPVDAPEPKLVCANAFWDKWHSGLWTLNTTAAKANVTGAQWDNPIKGDKSVYRWAGAPGTAGRVQAWASNENPFPEASDTTGVWLSTDSGSTWSAQLRGLRMRRVSALEFSPDGRLLVAGLNGGGFFAADTAALLA